MRHLILKCLAPLASEQLQNKYIIHGTKDEYCLPSELLDRAASVVAQTLSAPAAHSGLKSSEIEALRQFDVVLKQVAKNLDVEKYSNDELIHSCNEWTEIRNAASTCLVAIGFDVSVWEQDNA